MAKLFDCFEKSGKIKDLTTVLEKGIHKYIKKEMKNGKWVYYYKLPNGKTVESDIPQQEAQNVVTPKSKRERLSELARRGGSNQSSLDELTDKKAKHALKMWTGEGYRLYRELEKSIPENILQLRLENDSKYRRDYADLGYDGALAQLKGELETLYEVYEDLPDFNEAPIYRGLHIGDADKFVTDIKTEGGFTLDALSSFTRDNISGGYNVVLYVREPKNAKYLGNLSIHANEHEVLVKKGVSYKLDKVFFQDSNPNIAYIALIETDSVTKSEKPQNFNKIINALFDAPLSKRNEVIEKSMIHKYIRREGTPGNYKYFYRDAEGKEYSTDKESEATRKEFLPVEKPDDRPLTDEGKPSEVTDESIAEAFRQGEAHHKADLIPLPKDINGLREYLEAGTKKHGGKNQFLASAEYLEAEPTLRAMYDDYKREKKEKEKEAKIAREVETARTKQNSPEIQANDVTAKLKAELEDSKTKAILTDAQTRAEADKALQKDLTEDNGEYTYARKSEIGNQGADIKASARHRRHQWDGLANAENSDDVNKYVKRDVILKEFPVDFISGMTPENMESRLAWYYVLKTLPAKPADLALRPNSDGFVKYLTPEGRIVGSRFMEKDNAGLKGLTMAEYSKMERKNYVESLLRAKDFIESKVKVDNQSGYGVLQSMTDFIRSETESLRDVDTYSPTANLWAKYWKSKLKRGSDTSVSGQVALALHHADYPQGAKGLANQSPLDSKERMELFTKLIEGKSLDSLKGIKRDVLKSEADFYQTPVDRKGPEYSNLKDVKAQTDLLMDKIKLKGLQWGNSVTDDERKYHLKQLSYAFKDLAEVTGLPEKFISLNGKLAMAIGARGKGRALAHYERNLKVINLTRANGVGSLAHEWGHALDNIMNEVINDTSSGFLSDNSYGNRKWNPETKSYTDEFTNKTSEAMVNLLNSEAWANYRKKATATYNGLSQHITKGADYWISRKEMFARLFEGYISKKLKSQDRSNSYLSSAPESDGLWPAEKTLDDLTPYVDNLLESIKNSDLIEKAMKMWAIEELNQLLKSFK